MRSLKRKCFLQDVILRLDWDVVWQYLFFLSLKYYSDKTKLTNLSLNKPMPDNHHKSAIHQLQRVLCTMKRSPPSYTLVHHYHLLLYCQWAVCPLNCTRGEKEMLPQKHGMTLTVDPAINKSLSVQFYRFVSVGNTPNTHLWNHHIHLRCQIKKTYCVLQQHISLIMLLLLCWSDVSFINIKYSPNCVHKIYYINTFE